MLHFSKVKKRFNGRAILDIPSLDLDSNLYWVKGANGSGKSTFLRMIAGIIPFEGRIIYNQVDAHLSPVQYRQNISWADAEPAYPAFMTGQSLLDFYTDVRQGERKQAARLVDRIGLRDFIDAKIGTFSSGTLKKFSLLLAFVGNPTLIMLDEPLITLDAVSVQIVCDLVDEKRSLGGLVLVSSHLEADDLVQMTNKILQVSNHTVKVI